MTLAGSGASISWGLSAQEPAVSVEKAEVDSVKVAKYRSASQEDQSEVWLFKTHRDAEWNSLSASCTL